MTKKQAIKIVIHAAKGRVITLKEICKNPLLFGTTDLIQALIYDVERAIRVLEYKEKKGIK